MNYQAKFMIIIFGLFGSTGTIGIIVSRVMNLNMSNTALVTGGSLFVVFVIGMFFIEKIGDYADGNKKQKVGSVD